MNHKILTFLRNYSYNIEEVNRLLVSSFLTINNIEVKKNSFIKGYIISTEDIVEYDILEQFIDIFLSLELQLNLEDLIKLFEYVISPKEKEVNGAVYTPGYIRKFIVDSVFKKYSEDNKDVKNIKIADIACGCGGFFITVIQHLRTITNKKYINIFEDNIYGLDVQEFSIVRTKLLLSLMAISDGEDFDEYKFNLFVGNALEFSWDRIHKINDQKGFDLIVGNPPYVSISKMDPNTRELLINWSVTKSGKPDLYIPFFQVGITNLKKNGILGYITVNTFLSSLNARELRNYFFQTNYDLTIINFGSDQVFRRRSTYTCICLVQARESGVVSYIKTKVANLSKLNYNKFLHFKYNELNHFKGWFFNDKRVSTIVSSIENTGNALGDKFEIRNGIATLRNKVYLFTPYNEDEMYYYFIKNEKYYKIEKSICVDIIKPNTLKTEDDIPLLKEKIIFPYNVSVIPQTNNDKHKRVVEIIGEQEMIIYFPFALKYLEENKEVLSLRDKGNKKYAMWYAFGRSQSLAPIGKKLFLPYIAREPYFVFSDEENLLFYNGYAIISDSERELKLIQKILKSSLFWFYIKNTSKPYEGNFFALSKNYIKNFGICDLTPKEEEYLLSETNERKLDSFIWSKYQLKPCD